MSDGGNKSIEQKKPRTILSSVTLRKQGTVLLFPELETFSGGALPVCASTQKHNTDAQLRGSVDFGHRLLQGSPLTRGHSESKSN